MDFVPFGKIARLSRGIVVTEKIDGTNACVYIGESGEFRTASRTRWITPDDDNFGFSAWAHENKECLMQLGPGHHFGEWWGQGIQRKYGLSERRFSLFNVTRWAGRQPACCHVVPVLYEGVFSEEHIDDALNTLRKHGSVCAPGFMDPEGVVVYHTAAHTLFKKTIHGDETPKGKPLRHEIP